MNIKEILKKNNFKDKEFAEYAGYTADGLREAIKKNDVRQCVYDSLIVFLCKKKGIDLTALIVDML